MKWWRKTIHRVSPITPFTTNQSLPPRGSHDHPDGKQDPHPQGSDHILEGHSAQATVALVAETEGVSRRTARRITAKAMDLVHRDLEPVDVQNPQLAAVLIHSLMEVAAKGRETGQLGASVAALRELAAMCGVGKHNMNHRGDWRP